MESNSYSVSSAAATTTCLPHYSVLISGMCVRYNDHLNSYASTEIYDYANNSVKGGPEMKVARCNHASVTLPTGDVAVFGGYNDKLDPRDLSSCEVFNVRNNSFSIVGNMLKRRDRPAAILLPIGVVLLIGGANWYSCLNTCEFFNSANNRFSGSEARMSVGRFGPTASLLPDGKILVCGGYDGTNFFQTTEIYNPATDSFSDGPLMTVGRCEHTATTLLTGKVLITGGAIGDSTSTEIYDPSTNSFTAGPKMLVTRIDHFSALLPDGRVLVGGGQTDESKQTEIYDPTTNSFTKGLDLLEVRTSASASNF